MSAPARLWIADGVLLVAAAAAALAVVDGRPGWGPVITIIVLAGLRAFDLFFAFRLQPKEQTDTWQLGEAIFIVAALTLEPRGALLVASVGLLVGLLASRLPIAKVLYNLGLELLPFAAGLAVFWVVGSPHGAVGVDDLAAAGLGAAVYFVSGALLFGVTRWMIYGDPMSETLAVSRFVLVQFACSVSIGLLAGSSAQISPFAPLLALPPVAMVQMVLTEHFRARRDRERIDGLFHAAVDAHASVLTEEIEHALYRATTRLLHSNSVVRRDPPGEGEWGEPMVVDGKTWWLIVSRADGVQPEEEDQRLLEALAAVGSAALENASLVEEIREQAITDPVTRLPNQILFQDRVTQATAAAWRTRERFAVVVLDLDTFKKVNDSLGHSNGNELLKIIGERLAASKRDVDTVARLGSDHYTLLLPDVGTAQTAGVMAEKLLAAIRRPIVLDGHELFMTASAGIAFFPEDGTHAEHLLRNADSAMHRAKSLGRDCYQIYAAGMNEQAHLRLARESELHNALLRGELLVRYQPQIDLRTMKIVGVEGLVRWQHPILGLLGPHEFVPLAEESGLIVEVDEWVLGEACRQGVRWQDDGLPPVRIAVNLSGRHFQGDRLLTTMSTVLADTGLDPTRLEIEVTEGIAVGDADDAIELLQEVRRLGVQVAIDDFGTGYSMLGRLQRFPIDRLKIDRTFVNEISSAHGEAPIVAAMIAMARSLRLEVVAEGVETLEQQTFLRHHGCDQAQGFLFSHAVDPDEVARLLRIPSVGLNVSNVS